MNHLAIPPRASLRAALVLMLLAAGATVALADAPRVENGADPAEGLVTADLQEMWRAGGEDDEIFFGNVGRVTADPQGNVVILDSQLSEAHVYDRDGEHLTTVGKEGDGPGEVRRPGDLFVMKDGTYCMLQTFPGKVIKLTGEGLPAGDATFSRGQSAQGQFGVLFRGLSHPAGMLLAGNQMSFNGAQSTQGYFLSICDGEAAQQFPLHTKSYEIDYSDFELSEADLDFVYNRIAVDGEGQVHVARERSGYEISVFGTDGGLVRIVSRKYEPLVRDDRLRAVQQRILEGIGAYYPTPPRRYVMEDTEPDISGMWAVKGGELWVQTSRGNAEPPAGSWTVLDVFDARGAFARQIALPGGYDPQNDALHVLPDGRLVVVTGALEAFLNQMAVASEDEAGGETTPLEVICYEIEN